jgi:hypothetical protein
MVNLDVKSATVDELVAAYVEAAAAYGQLSDVNDTGLTAMEGRLKLGCAETDNPSSEAIMRRVMSSAVASRQERTESGMRRKEERCARAPHSPPLR